MGSNDNICQPTRRLLGWKFNYRTSAMEFAPPFPQLTLCIYHDGRIIIGREKDPSYWQVSQTCNNARRSGYIVWLLACQPVCLILASNLWQNKPYSQTGIIPTMCCTYMRPYPTVIKVMAHHLRPRTKYLCIQDRHTHTHIQLSAQNILEKFI